MKKADTRREKERVRETGGETGITKREGKKGRRRDRRERRGRRGKYKW